MSNLIKNYFNPWWRPIVMWLLTSLLFALTHIGSDRSFSAIIFIPFALCLFLVFVSGIYQLSQKNWLTGFLSIGIFVVIVVSLIGYLILSSFMAEESKKEWAKNLTIPTDIVVNEPVDLYDKTNRADIVKSRKLDSMDFQLYNSIQPGIYQYDFWIDSIERGTIFLKAFEITQNYRLSSSRLQSRSSMKISNATSSFERFGSSRDFTIYEGDWGDPYAARFEVWFKPDSGGPTRKLYSKNYKIEGWMR